MDTDQLLDMLQNTELEPADGKVSFEVGVTTVEWTNVYCSVLGRTILVASPVPFDSPQYPAAGVIMFTFPNSLPALKPVDFGLGEQQVALLFSYGGGIPPLPGLGPTFTLEIVAPGKIYKGNFSCRNLSLTGGTFDINL
ncbi:hypothetical protein [Pseudomonas sp. PB106]|uniref:hypothetical protein n=1 Tax=Pseudomonas sp. PB106 TaxID=2494699 RepID=UPI00131C5776|nr:hypothetical protein [Pseudomonas sp. PB106]KAE9639214.1 hypothetical protein EJA71_25710 [Pseudomonas sp. PB106]